MNARLADNSLLFKSLGLNVKKPAEASFLEGPEGIRPR